MARERLKNLYHLKRSVAPIPRISGGGMRAATLQYQLQGENLQDLADTANSLIVEMKKVPGFVDLSSTYDAGKPEVSIKPDYDRAAEMGISTRELGDAVRTLIGGEEVSTYEEDGETYDIRVRLTATDRDRPESILDVPVRTDSGKWIGLHNIVDVKETVGPVQIDRRDRKRLVTIMGNLDQSKTLGAAQEDIKNLVKQKGLPAGVVATYGGDAEMMEESYASMIFSLMLAVLLIYMVLAAQFESLIHPFTVMLSLPLSIVGALGLLALTGRTGNIFSMIGIIMLMGLVTKNAILLIDYTNFLRREKGMEREDALRQAGPVRLRPILMTAFSTIAGMLPVAIGLGEGAETRAPMGTAIVGGMITSTILTLVVIPVVYSIMDDFGLFCGRLFSHKDESQEVAEPQVDEPIPEIGIAALVHEQ